MYVIVEPDASFKHRIIGYYDLWHGECRPACVIKYESEKSTQVSYLGAIHCHEPGIREETEFCSGNDGRQTEDEGRQGTSHGNARGSR